MMRPITTPALALLITLSGCVGPAEDAPAAEPAITPGCHFVPPEMDQPDCSSDAQLIQTADELEGAWYCSSDLMPGLALYRTPLSGHLALRSEITPPTYSVDASQRMTAAIEVADDERSGFYAWSPGLKKEYVVFPDPFANEVQFKVIVLGLVYDINVTDSMAGAVDAPHPIWKRWTDHDRDLLGEFLLLHHVRLDADEYYFANHSFLNKTVIRGEPQPQQSVGLGNVVARAAAFDFSASIVTHIDGRSGKMDLTRPDSGCTVGSDPVPLQPPSRSP